MNAIVSIDNNNIIGESIKLPDNFHDGEGKEALISAVMEFMGGYDIDDKEDRELFIEQDGYIIEDLLDNGVCDLNEDTSLQIIQISG